MFRGKFLMSEFSIFKDSKVLITGNTGFKGSWLSVWLRSLGARVVGVSIDIPTSPSLFEAIGLQECVKQYFADITDYGVFKGIIAEERPDFVFHLAAQPIVSKSYTDPLGTISTNTLGSVTVLKGIENLDKRCVVVMITSDKCYENVEWEWGYKETDRLGGKDIYSSSKGAAEILISSFIRSFLCGQDEISVGIGRAGNVIGGGDWASDRLVVDIVKKWSANSKVELRSPNSVRPWQHVLEPLSGYLTLASNLYHRKINQGEAFNFGPRSDVSHSVEEVVERMQFYWFGVGEKEKHWTSANKLGIQEAGLLKLNCEKAGVHLDWFPALNINETLSMVVDWYKRFYSKSENMYDYTLHQLKEYLEIRTKISKW
jgi:CDP-glucose 4,6-dehydratase